MHLSLWPTPVRQSTWARLGIGGGFAGHLINIITRLLLKYIKSIMNLLIHGTDSCGVFAHPTVVDMAFFCYSFGSTCDTMFSDIYLNCGINSMTVAYFRLLLD